jgi:predicted RNA methylase
MISFIDKVINLTWELRLGIVTRGIAGIDTSDDEHIHYGTVPYRTINTILEHLHLHQNDVFVDLGCGKGRVLCCSSLKMIHRSIGVECSPFLSSIAMRNAVVLRRTHSPIDILTMEAQKFNFSVGTIFYLFHPFGPATLREVLHNLKAGLDRSPRSVRIVYINPVHQEVFHEFPWLEEYDHWTPRYNLSPEHHVAWWKNITTV